MEIWKELRAQNTIPGKIQICHTFEHKFHAEFAKGISQRAQRVLGVPGENLCDLCLKHKGVVGIGYREIGYKGKSL